MKSCLLNAAIGAIVTAVVFTVAGCLSDQAVKPKPLTKNVYIVDMATVTAPSTAAPMPTPSASVHNHAAADAEPIDIKTLLAKADIAAGQKTAKQCSTCHSFGKGEAAKMGPNLYGVVGGPHAHMAGFKYSEAMMGVKDHKWDFAELNSFIRNPKAHLPGTKMAFAGLKNDQDRANVIAYLNSLSDHPLSLTK